MVDKTNQAKVTLDCAVYALSEDNLYQIYICNSGKFPLETIIVLDSQFICVLAPMSYPLSGSSVRGYK
jgi:hypothetical protein